MKGLSEDEREFIVRAYAENEFSVVELAGICGITRQGVYKVLRGAGVDTRKRRLEVERRWCGKRFMKTKKRVRVSLRHYCSSECYWRYLEELGRDYLPGRRGQRMARLVVSRWFDLRDSMVVHHEDRDTLNNLPQNLKVFLKLT